MIDVCGQTVELARGDRMISASRDRRGLAHALTGDYVGAIEDFEFLWSGRGRMI